MGSVQRCGAAFPVTGIVFTDVHERLEVRGFRPLFGRDVTGGGFIVSTLGVTQDLLRPVSRRVVSAAVVAVAGLVGLALEGLGA